MSLLREFLILFPLCLIVISTKCPNLVTDFSQINCTDKTDNDSNESYYYSVTETCIPKCKKYPEAFGKCSTQDPCAPGYFCEKRCVSNNTQECQTNDDCHSHDICENLCVSEHKQSCMAYHIKKDIYKDTYYTAKFKPQCNDDGTWQAKQCKGGVEGRCMCYDANGIRIFGDALYENAENMTCACSRRKADLLATGQLYYVSFHCDSKGNYEKLQCNVIKEQCWCLEPKTGKLTSPFVPQKAMKFLPCYTESDIGSQYLRQCESKDFAQNTIDYKTKLHGLKYIKSNFILCDDDGAYGSYIVNMDNAFCTWRNGSKIAAYQSNVQLGIGDLNCNCARDHIKYDVSESCSAGGNYADIQHTDATSWYCVDQDGFSKTQMFSSSSNLNCSQYY